MSGAFYFMAGLVAGFTLQRIATALLMGKLPDSICDYCKLKHEKK